MIRVRGLWQKSLKNRSSKNLMCMTGPGTKPVLWSWSGEALRKHSSECKDANCNIYQSEIQRRLRNAAKRKTPRPGSKAAAAV